MTSHTCINYQQQLEREVATCTHHLPLRRRRRRHRLIATVLVVAIPLPSKKCSPNSQTPIIAADISMSFLSFVNVTCTFASEGETSLIKSLRRHLRGDASPFHFTTQRWVTVTFDQSHARLSYRRENNLNESLYFQPPPPPPPPPQPSSSSSSSSVPQALSRAHLLPEQYKRLQVKKRDDSPVLSSLASVTALSSLHTPVHASLDRTKYSPPLRSFLQIKTLQLTLCHHLFLSRLPRQTKQPLARVTKCISGQSVTYILLYSLSLIILRVTVTFASMSIISNHLFTRHGDRSRHISDDLLMRRSTGHTHLTDRLIKTSTDDAWAVSQSLLTVSDYKNYFTPQDSPAWSVSVSNSSLLTSNTLSSVEVLTPDDRETFQWTLFTISVSIILTLLILTTIIGNIFVIIAILVERNLQTFGNYLVFSLAIADLMVAGLVMPIGAIYEVTGEWIFNSTLCDFWTCIDVLSCTASILHLVAIALDRYWAVTNIDYIHSRSSQSIGRLICAVWTVAIIISAAPILGWKDDNYFTRIEIEKKCLISQDVGYQVLATCATFYGPLIVILILYWKIFKVARERIRHKPGSRLTSASPKPATSQLQVMRSTTEGSDSSDPSPADSNKNVKWNKSCPADGAVSREHNTGVGEINEEVEGEKFSTSTSGEAGEEEDGEDGDEDEEEEEEEDDDDDESGERKRRKRRRRGNAPSTKVSRVTSDVITGEASSSSHGEKTGEHLPNESDSEGEALRQSTNKCTNEIKCNDVDDCVKGDKCTSSNGVKEKTFPSPRTRMPVQWQGETVSGSGSGSVSETVYTECTSEANKCLTTDPGESDCIRSTRLSSLKSVSLSSSPVPSRSSVVTCSPFKASSISTAVTNVSPSPCLKRKTNLPGKVKEARVNVKVDKDHGSTKHKSPEEAVSKKSKKVTSSLLRSGSGSKVTQVISTRESIEAKRERKAAKTLAIITGAFVVCWLPFFLMALILPICGDACFLPQLVQEIFQWLGYINSLINPIIYTIFSLEFRAAFKKLGNSMLGRPAAFNYRHRPVIV